jgi:predicted AAA+ superfamily ATPase
MVNQFRIQQSELLQPTDKVTILLGPRQVGKTTLLKNTFPQAAYINLEKDDYIDVFNSRNVKKIQQLFSDLDIVKPRPNLNYT